jgi:NADH-quinone oxidoreductase subunit L
LPNVFAFIGLLMVVRAYVERKSAKTAWSLVTAMHFWLALAVSFNEHFAIVQFVLYLSGVTVAMVVGFACIFYLESKEGAINVDHYQGHAFEHPTLYLVFFLACMGITGFPITPTFIGEDLILSHIHEHQIPLVTIAALSLVIDGLAVIRIFAKVFNGPHIKNYHEIAYKSS